MIRSILHCLLLTLLFWHCSRDVQPGSIRQALEPPRQTFIITTGRDTSITCAGGTVIKLCANTFQTDAATVTLEVRELLTRSDMFGAGIGTRSTDGRLLESEGMIFFNAVLPEGATIRQDCPVEIQLPARYLRGEMSLFKGVDHDGTIDWQWIGEDAVAGTSPFLNNAELNTLRSGKILFERKCAACHCCDLTTVLVAPALGNITRYRDSQWLRDYTRSSQSMVRQGDSLATCLWERWKPILMPDFRELSDPDLAAIYAWIESESKRLDVRLDSVNYACPTAVEHMASGNDSITDSAGVQPIQPVFIRNPRLDSYLFKAYEFGWYNCDVFMQETTEAELIVTINDAKRYDDLVVSLLYDRRKANLPLTSFYAGSPDAYFALAENKRTILAYEPARIVAVALRGDKWFLAEHSLVIGAKNEVSLSLRRLQKKDVEAVLKKDAQSIREKIATQDSAGCPCAVPRSISPK